MKIKPMKLGRVDQITYVLLAIAVFLLLLAGWKNIVLLAFGALAVFVVAVVFRIIYWRCPACGGYLWRNRKENCQHCGATLEK